MVRENELPPSYFWQYLGDTYAATQALAIRRQADLRKDVISLARLLTDLSRDAGYMTRQAFLELWPEDDQGYASMQFAGPVRWRGGEASRPCDSDSRPQGSSRRIGCREGLG
jgi:hypothetical protein